MWLTLDLGVLPEMLALPARQYAYRTWEMRLHRSVFLEAVACAFQSSPLEDETLGRIIASLKCPLRGSPPRLFVLPRLLQNERRKTTSYYILELESFGTDYKGILMKVLDWY